MAIKKVIEIDVDVLNANGGLDNLTKSFKEVDNSTKSLKLQLREAVNEVQQLSQQYGESSKEAINAAKKAADLKDRIEDANDAIQAFKGEGTFLATSKALAGVASGFGAVQGAMGLLGTENKDLERQLLKVQSAMALADGLAGLEDTGRAFKQLGAVVKSNVVIQGLYATAVGVSTGAMKVFRLALVATGVGALVVGLGLLIANFDKVKKVVMDFVPGLASVGKAIENIVQQVTDFVGITSEADRAIEKQKDYAEKSLKQTEKYLLLNEHKLTEAKKKELQLRKEHFQRVIDGEVTQAQSVKIYKEKVAKEDEKAQQEINAKRLQQQKEAQEKINQANEEARKKREQERKEERDNLNASAKELQETRDRIEAEKRKKEAELKEQAKAIQDRLAEENKPELSEREALEAKYQMEYDLLVSANESTLALQSKYTADVLALNDKERQQRIKDAEEERIRTQAVSDAKIDIAKNTLNLIAEIAGRGSKIGKGIAIAQATISGIEGVQNAYTTAQKSPITIGLPAYPFIQAGLAGAFSLLQIKKIASTSMSGGGGAPSIGGSASGGGGGGAQPPSFNVVGNSGVNQIAQTLNQEQPPIQAYVVANNVTTAQSANRNIIENASLG